MSKIKLDNIAKYTDVSKVTVSNVLNNKRSVLNYD
ncbi:LacI family DNA-binding transcriptional regulator [Halanaerobium saccharolyticum]